MRVSFFMFIYIIIFIIFVLHPHGWLQIRSHIEAKHLPKEMLYREDYCYFNTHEFSLVQISSTVCPRSSDPLHYIT